MIKLKEKLEERGTKNIEGEMNKKQAKEGI